MNIKALVAIGNRLSHSEKKGKVLVDMKITPIVVARPGNPYKNFRTAHALLPDQNLKCPRFAIQHFKLIFWLNNIRLDNVGFQVEPSSEKTCLGRN